MAGLRDAAARVGWLRVRAMAGMRDAAALEGGVRGG